jgi:hypothetical protein
LLVIVTSLRLTLAALIMLRPAPFPELCKSPPLIVRSLMLTGTPEIVKVRKPVAVLLRIEPLPTISILVVRAG